MQGRGQRSEPDQDRRGSVRGHRQHRIDLRDHSADMGRLEHHGLGLLERPQLQWLELHHERDLHDRRRRLLPRRPQMAIQPADLGELGHQVGRLRRDAERALRHARHHPDDGDARHAFRAVLLARRAGPQPRVGDGRPVSVHDEPSNTRYNSNYSSTSGNATSTNASYNYTYMNNYLQDKVAQVVLRHAAGNCADPPYPNTDMSAPATRRRGTQRRAPATSIPGDVLSVSVGTESRLSAGDRAADRHQEHDHQPARQPQSLCGDGHVHPDRSRLGMAPVDAERAVHTGYIVVQPLLRHDVEGTRALHRRRQLHYGCKQPQQFVFQRLWFSKREPAWHDRAARPLQTRR